MFPLQDSTPQPFTGASAAINTWNKKSRSRCFIPIRRIPLCLHLLCLLLAASGSISTVSAQPIIAITIAGDITETQRHNIRSHLSLARLKANDALSATMFNRLYAKIEKEAALALQPFGYYTPSIRVAKQLANGRHLIDITVTAGQPVTIQELQLSLTGPGQEEASLRKAVQAFPLHRDDQLDHQRYEEAKEQLIAVALDSGYLKAAFRQNRVEIRRKVQTASMHLQLDTGPRYTFGPIRFTADFIDHELLRKIAPVKEGDPFSPKALIRMRQALFNADYFSTVELDYDIEKTIAAKVPVHVILTPNFTHTYGVGLGYGTDTGPRATLGYTNRLINRFGHQLDLQWQPSERKSNFGGVYTIPIGNPKKDRLSILGKYEIENFAGTNAETWASTISHDHFREQGEFSTYLRLLDEQYSTGLDSGHSALVIPGVKGSVFWADDRIATTRGLRITTSLIGSGAGVLADTSFLQAAVHAKGLYTFFDKWRFIGRADLGTTLTDDIYGLPPSLRYYAGGDQSVRGYGYKKISPTDAAGNVIGDKNLLTYSLELERVLFDEWRGAVFYDSGSVMNSFSKFSLQSGAGIGVRWNAPFGQIRLDLAKALDDETNSWRIHFTMGADL